VMRECSRCHTDLTGQWAGVGVAVAGQQGENLPASWLRKSLTKPREVIQGTAAGRGHVGKLQPQLNCT